MAADEEADWTGSADPEERRFLGLIAERKVSARNAFDLDLDAEPHLDAVLAAFAGEFGGAPEDFLRAANVLDASARVYGFRVDAVHKGASDFDRNWHEIFYSEPAVDVREARRLGVVTIARGTLDGWSTSMEEHLVDGWYANQAKLRELRPQSCRKILADILPASSSGGFVLDGRALARDPNPSSLASPGPEAEAASARHAKAMAADLARPHGRLEAALVPWFAEAFGLAVAASKAEEVVVKVERGENQEPIELINISDSEDEGPRLEGLLRAAGTTVPSFAAGRLCCPAGHGLAGAQGGSCAHCGAAGTRLRLQACRDFQCSYKVCHECCARAREQAELAPPPSVCPEGHPLAERKNPDMSFACRHCRVPIRRGAAMHVCRDCDYRLCPCCVAAAAAVTASHGAESGAATEPTTEPPTGEDAAEPAAPEAMDADEEGAASPRGTDADEEGAPAPEGVVEGELAAEYDLDDAVGLALLGSLAPPAVVLAPLAEPEPGAEPAPKTRKRARTKDFFKKIAKLRKAVDEPEEEGPLRRSERLKGKDKPDYGAGDDSAAEPEAPEPDASVPEASEPEAEAPEPVAPELDEPAPVPEDFGPLLSLSQLGAVLERGGGPAGRFVMSDRDPAGIYARNVVSARGSLRGSLGARGSVAFRAFLSDVGCSASEGLLAALELAGTTPGVDLEQTEEQRRTGGDFTVRQDADPPTTPRTRAADPGLVGTPQKLERPGAAAAADK